MGKHPWFFILFGSFLMWDYTAHQQLAMFVMYLHKPGEQYNWEQPSWTVVSIKGEPQTKINCLELTLMEPGPWHAVMKALDTLGKQSDPSNEIVFTWDPVTGCTGGTSLLPPPPASRPPQRIGPTPIPPAPPYTPPVVFKPPSPAAMAPPSPPARDGSTGGGGISNHCIWNGDCGKSRLSK